MRRRASTPAAEASGALPTCSLDSAQSMARTPRSSSWRLRAATARAWIEPSRRSSARSSSTGRPSTCARRSSTTSTWSSSSASAARSSSTRRPRCRRGDGRLLRPRGGAQRARQRGGARPQTIDATCPLVTKVHVEAKKFAAQGYTIVLIGHEGHEEVEGTMGEAPDSIVLIETEEDVDDLEVADPERVAYLTADHALGGRDRPDHPPAARALPQRSPGRVPTTSVTPPPTASSPSARWRASATWCS